MKTQGRLILVRKYLPIIIVCAFSVLISLLIGPNRYLQRMLILVLVWAAACSSFNIISGYGGQVVFGYMMFLGTGAYSTVLLFKFLEISPWFGMLIGAIVAAIIAFIVGLPTLRLRGAYFAVATVAFPLITIPILNHLGFEEISIPFVRRASAMQFADIRVYVILGAALLAVTLIIVRIIENSSFGFSLRATKQNQTAAEGMGIKTHRTKLLAFMLSAALGAVTGTVYAFGIQYMLSTHSMFGLFIIVRILSISIVGGLGTLWGPVMGAAILVPMGEFLSSEVGDRYPGVQDIVYGAAIVAAIIYLPEGIWGRVSGAFHHFLGRSARLIPPKAPKEVAIEKPFSMGSLNLGSIWPEFLERKRGDSILQIRTISKSFGGVVPLLDVNIEVPRGSILGIIGPNGAGKTTLFNVINGYLTPDSGEILFQGEDVTGKKPHAICRLGIGRTFQIPQIFGDMTLLENICIGAVGKGYNVSKALAISRKIAEQLGISSRRCNDRAVGLSAMENKILEFSRALATQPELVLVDEPMAGVNPEEANEIGRMIKEISRNGITVVVIEHVVQSLVKISDRMVGLDAGRIVSEGTPEQVVSDPHMIEAYLGAKWKERYAKG
jgi:ABC-type branched-subunit amino acid transport system ATPase component/ABC-type branched-subunit amino acid transport system permease subunit